MEVVWSPRARADLDDIRVYLRQRNPAASRSVVAAIREAAISLADAPYIGHEGDDGIREWLVNRYPNYLLLYGIRRSPQTGQMTVIVLRVWHQSRDR